MGTPGGWVRVVQGGWQFVGTPGGWGRVGPLRVTRGQPALFDCRDALKCQQGCSSGCCCYAAAAAAAAVFARQACLLLPVGEVADLTHLRFCFGGAPVQTPCSFH